jgi:pimeloyl-ACP methyl ester carboxylesterase
MRSRFRILCIAIVLAFLWPDDALSRSSRGPSERWHVPSVPQVISQEIQFANGDVHLVGTVYLPKNGSHLPGVVVLHHAGVATREAELYRHLRVGLPTMGFAVLIYDRRGSGQSGGETQSADYETLADDAVAGQHALAKLSRIDPNNIGFWGLSQGGWLAVLAAGRSNDAAFAISVSAPLVTAEEQMEFAMGNLLTVRGYSEADVREMLETRKAWTNYLHGGNSRDVALEALRKAESKPWFDLVYLPRPSQLTVDPEHDPSRRRLDDDPIGAVLQAKVPLLFLYGDSDPWVPVARSVERLQSLLKKQQDIEYAVIADANHEMMIPGNETMQVDANTTHNNAPQTPAYFVFLGSWLSHRVAK